MAALAALLPGGRKRVAGVAATITHLRSGFRSGERAQGLGLPFPVPTSVRAELVPR